MEQAETDEINEQEDPGIGSEQARGGDMPQTSEERSRE